MYNVALGHIPSEVFVFTPSAFTFTFAFYMHYIYFTALVTCSDRTLKTNDDLITHDVLLKIKQSKVV